MNATDRELLASLISARQKGDAANYYFLRILDVQKRDAATDAARRSFETRRLLWDLMGWDSEE